MALINGNNQANKLFGTNYADIINGLAGPDVMCGGLGNDVYYVDNGGDLIGETGGIDTVISSVNFNLHTRTGGYFSALGTGYVTPGTGGVENLTLTGLAVSATGNCLNNVLIGNSLSNSLFGYRGNDTLKGGLGNDVYYLDNSRDVVVEGAAGGIDTIVLGDPSINNASAATLFINIPTFTGNGYSMSANVENLRAYSGLCLTSTTNGTFNLYGNALDNNINLSGTVLFSKISVFAGAGNDVIWGGASNDYIDGGLGADVMCGGRGNDVYVVDNAGDVIANESIYDSFDCVLSTVDYTLPTNVENLTLQGAAVSATGNTLNNIIEGNAVGNMLTGMAGADTFYFTAPLDGIANVDTITDFVSGTDKIALLTQLGTQQIVDPVSGAIVNAPIPGPFASTAATAGYTFLAAPGAAATTTTAFVLYDTNTGILSFDADGIGAGAAIAFAQLTGIPALTGTDIVLA